MEKSLVNAIAYAKRNCKVEKYSFMETLLDAGYGYNLRKDEMEVLIEKVTDYCKKNLYYIGEDFEWTAKLALMEY